MPESALSICEELSVSPRASPCFCAMCWTLIRSSLLKKNFRLWRVRIMTLMLCNVHFADGESKNRACLLISKPEDGALLTSEDFGHHQRFPPWRHPSCVIKRVPGRQELKGRAVQTGCGEYLYWRSRAAVLRWSWTARVLAGSPP